MSTAHLSTKAAQAIARAEFRPAWPIEVRKALVRAAQHEGEFPPYAVRHVEWALREAKRIERRMSRQYLEGLRVMPHSMRKKLKVAR